MKDPKIAGIGTLAVVIHAVIAVVHGMAHSDLGIEMTTLQNAFINIVIGATPVIAAIILWTKFARLGAVLLAASMIGALVFGVYYHYIAISPDHVSHLPEGNLQGLFRVTAFLLPISEAFGMSVGIWGFIRMRGGLRVEI